MSDERSILLVKKIASLTEAGKLSWERMPSRAGLQLRVSIGDTTITLRSKDGYSNQPDIVLSVIDDTGAVVESFSDVDIQDDEKFPDSFDVMENMFNRAKRIALGTDKVISNLLTDLDSM